MNHKFKGMFKWLDTFYGKDFTDEEFYLQTDKFEYHDYLDDYDENGDFVLIDTNIDSFKFIYSKISKHLDVHHDLWADMGENFNAPYSECKIVFKEWFGNKFDVDIDQVNYWQTT
jgi:hypothetical protein